MKMLYIFMILFLLISKIDIAQNFLKGSVTDQNHNPLPGANIFIYDLNKGTVAGTDGSYTIENIPDGKFRIQYSFIGYSSEVKTIIFTGEQVTIDMAMHETSIETKEVVISGGYNATQHENAVNIERLKLNTSTNKLTPNTAEILARVPGVNMISKGPGVAKPVIRGLSMDNVLVLNNGIRNENYQYSDHHPLGLDEYGVEDVEIIKGPASLLYGPDAIGGVVNFIQERPAPVGKIMGDYHLQLFSNTLGVSTNLGLKGTSKKFFGGVRIGMKTNADFLQGGGDYVPNSRFNTLSFKANMGYTGKRVSLKLFYEYNLQKLGLSEDEAVEEIESRSRRNEVWYQQFDNHLFSSQNKIFMNKFKIELNAAFQSVELVHFAGIDEKEIDMRLQTLSYEVKVHLPSTEKSDYIVGFQGFNQENRNIPGAEEVLLPDASTGNYGFFTLLQYYFFHGFKFQGGLRYDHKAISTETYGVEGQQGYRASLDKGYDGISGSVGATYEFRDRLFFRLNFASAFRTPNLAELTSNGLHETRYETGSSDLIPQKAYETDLSIHYHVENLTFDLAGFYNIVNDYIFISPTGDTTFEGYPVYLYTQHDALLYGGEAGFHLHPERLKWVHFEATFSSVRGIMTNGDNLPFIPADNINFELKFEKDKVGKLVDSFVRINSSTTFRQDRPAPEEEATGGYSLLDFAIGTTIPAGKQQIMVELAVNNIFDKKYIDYLSTLKEVNYFNPGRNIALSVSVPFIVK
jgi:iron complex outermembrane recepter protein